MAHRNSAEINQEFQNKLHALGGLRWQETDIPIQIEKVEEDLKSLQKEYILAVKMETKKADKEKPEDVKTNGEAPPFETKPEAQPLQQ